MIWSHLADAAAAPTGPPYPGTAWFIRGTAANNIWLAVSWALVHDALRYDGGTWISHPYNGADPTPFIPSGFHVAGADAVWIQTTYQISVWDGAGWGADLLTNSALGDNFRGLYGFGSDVWALQTRPTDPAVVLWTDHRSGGGSWSSGTLSGAALDSLEGSPGAAWDTDHAYIPISTTTGASTHVQIVAASLTGGGYSVEFDQIGGSVGVIGATSATQAYGITTAGTAGYGLLSRDGGAWNLVGLGSVAGSTTLWPRAVAGISGDEWLAGDYADGTAPHWPFVGHNTGAGWTLTDLAPLLATVNAASGALYSVLRLPDGDVWASGTYTTVDDPTRPLVLVLRRVAGTWTVVPVPAS